MLEFFWAQIAVAHLLITFNLFYTKKGEMDVCKIVRLPKQNNLSTTSNPPLMLPNQIFNIWNSFEMNTYWATITAINDYENKTNFFTLNIQ